MAAVPKGLYHHINCDHLKGLKIGLSPAADRKRLAILGMSSKETVRAGLLAVDASPFKTIFVVRESTGEVLFAISKNEEYVAAAKKKRPKPTPPTTPPKPPVSDCCMKCRYADGTQAPCYNIGDDACRCNNEEGGGTGGLDDQLETWAF